VTAAHGHAVGRQRRIGSSEERNDFFRSHRRLRGESCQGWRNRDRLICAARGAEKVIRTEAGTCAVGAPFMFQQAPIGVNVFEGRRIAGAGGIRAFLGIASVCVLRPEAMQHERRVRCALWRVSMRITELRRPGQVKQVIVKASACRYIRMSTIRACRRFNGWLTGAGRLAGSQRKEAHQKRRHYDGESRGPHAAQDNRCKLTGIERLPDVTGGVAFLAKHSMR
jgi:hypothetical protein